MKGAIAATALAALAGAASAAHQHRHAHELFAKRNATGEVCIPGCTTYWTTYLGAPTFVPAPVPVAEPTTTVTSTSMSTTTAIITKAPIASTPEAGAPAPTPQPKVCPTPGTYTFPATTVTVTDTTTVCAATSTAVPPGTHTLGGVTTIVETATTVVCPVAAVKTTGGVVTSTIVMTTYVCPEAGTYTIAPITTTVSESTDVVYPIATTYPPGTYTAPAAVVTVTKTDYTYWCPFESSGLPTGTSVAAAEPTTTSKAAPPAQTTTEAAAAESTTEAPKPSSSSAAAKPQPTLGSSNNRYGIIYTPYEPSNGNCKSASEVDSDIQSIKNAGFQVVRTYSTDCDTVVNVGNSVEKYGLKMFIGVFIDGTGCDYNTPNVKEQVDVIAGWAKWDLVEGALIANEAVMNNFCTASQLQELIVTVKSKWSGFTGPYSTAEPVSSWQEPGFASAICGVVDIVVGNTHAYFDSGCTPSSAGAFVASQLELLADACPGKQAISGECGWPTAGKCNGKACPGTSEQSTAIQSIQETVGNKVILFSPYNDNWKAAGDCGCEKSWGLGQLFGITDA